MVINTLKQKYKKKCDNNEEKIINTEKRCKYEENSFKNIYISGAIGYHNLKINEKDTIIIRNNNVEVDILPFINYTNINLSHIHKFCNTMVINEIRMIYLKGCYLGMEDGMVIAYDCLCNGDLLKREQKGKYVLIYDGDEKRILHYFDNMLFEDE